MKFCTLFCNKWILIPEGFFKRPIGKNQVIINVFFSVFAAVLQVVLYYGKFERDTPGEGNAVLISLWLTTGLETIQERRGQNTEKPVLLTGPGKVCFISIAHSWFISFMILYITCYREQDQNEMFFNIILVTKRQSVLYQD